jgi:hypothetical protein
MATYTWTADSDGRTTVEGPGGLIRLDPIYTCDADPAPTGRALLEAVLGRPVGAEHAGNGSRPGRPVPHYAPLLFGGSVDLSEEQVSALLGLAGDRPAQERALAEQDAMVRARVRELCGGR